MGIEKHKDVIKTFESIDFRSLVNSTVKKAKAFRLQAVKKLDELVADLEKRHPGMMYKIFVLDERNGNIKVHHHQNNPNSNAWFFYDQNDPKNCPFYWTISPPSFAKRETMAVRFLKLQEIVGDLSKEFAGDNSLELDIWKVIYCNAMTDEYRRWLLTNITNQEVGSMILKLVSSIAKDIDPKYIDTELEEIDIVDSK
jgi:hypothetical protein